MRIAGRVPIKKEVQKGIRSGEKENETKKKGKEKRDTIADTPGSALQSIQDKRGEQRSKKDQQINTKGMPVPCMGKPMVGKHPCERE